MINEIKLSMDITRLTNPTVKNAIAALQSGDSAAWFSLFTPDVVLLDDGRRLDFQSFFQKALGHEHFTSIDKIDNNGNDVYGHFHSDQWGDFKTFFKFTINPEGKVSKLEIGQATY